MTEAYVFGIAQNVLNLTLILAGPVLLISLLVGSLVSLFQAATQINEVTLNFVPKIIGVAILLMVLGSWMTQQLVSFTTNLFESLASLPI